MFAINSSFGCISFIASGCDAGAAAPVKDRFGGQIAPCAALSRGDENPGTVVPRH